MSLIAVTVLHQSHDAQLRCFVCHHVGVEHEVMFRGLVDKERIFVGAHTACLRTGALLIEEQGDRVDAAAVARALDLDKPPPEDT